MNVNDHPLYATWHHMLVRCYNPKCKDYKNWGWRGITVCEQWRSLNPRGSGFRAFAKDMGPRPRGYTLDRINNDGNYEPSNCRWATRQQQALNSRYKESLAKAVATHAANKRAQTHCKHGHKFTPQNTYLYKGMRTCRICRRAWDRFLFHGKKIPIEKFFYPVNKRYRKD